MLFSFHPSHPYDFPLLPSGCCRSKRRRFVDSEDQNDDEEKEQDIWGDPAVNANGNADHVNTHELAEGRKSAGQLPTRPTRLRRLVTKRYPDVSLRDDSEAFGDMYPAEGSAHAGADAGADEPAGPSILGARWGELALQQTSPVHYEEEGAADDASMDVMQSRTMIDRHLGRHSRRGRMSALFNPQDDVGSRDPPLAPSNDPPASQSGGSNVRLKFRFGSIPTGPSGGTIVAGQSEHSLGLLASGSTEAGLYSGEGQPLRSESDAAGADASAASRTRICISLRR